MAIDPTRVRHRPYDDPYGQCSACDGWQRLTTRGNLYQHQSRDRYGICTGKQCDGVGKPPRAAKGTAGILCMECLGPASIQFVDEHGAPIGTLCAECDASHQGMRDKIMELLRTATCEKRQVD